MKPEQRGEFVRLLDEQDSVTGFETLARRKDGRLIWISLTARARRGPDRSVLNYEGIVEDVTERKAERKRAEDAQQRLVGQLELARRRVDNLMSSVPGVVWEAWGQPDAADQKIDFVSEHVEQMLGYSVEEWLSSPNFWLTIVHPEDRERAGNEAASIYAGERPGRSEFRWVGKDGRVVWVEAQSAVIRNQAGEPVGMRGVTMDITERKLAENRLQETNARTEQLQLVTAALSESLTPYEVGRVVIEAARVVVAAHSGTIAVLYDDGTLQLIASEGVTDGFGETWPGFAADPPQQIINAIKAGIPMFLESRHDLLRDFPGLARLDIVEGRSFGCVPLQVENRAIGAMVLTFEGAPPDPAGREFVLALARQCAQALERARLYEAERGARAAAEFAADRTGRLQTITAALSEALTPAQVAEIVIQHAVNALSADAGVVSLVDSGAGSVRVLSSTGYSAETMALWREIPLDSQTPGPEAVRTGAPIFTENRGQLLAAFPLMREISWAGYDSMAVLPLIVEGRTIGVVTVSFRSPRHFGAEDQAFLFALARLCAQALERARLFEAEQAARADAEVAEQRQAFLAQASAILASSLEFEATLAEVARLCVPYLADWCAMDILDGEQLVCLALAHSETSQQELGERIHAHFPPDLERDSYVKRVVRDGESLLFPEMSDSALAKAVHGDDHLRELRQLGLQAMVMLPLKARARTLGMVTLAYAESGRRYCAADLAMAEDLARRVALALDNARLFRESQQIQEELRRANESKDEFLGLVSHELRTPITTIYGGARLLRSRGDNLDAESKAGVLDDIEHESERLHRIVEDLLVLARVELGQEVVTEPVLLQRVTEKASAAFQRRRPGREVRCLVPPDLEPVRASSTYIEQILRNLIDNADKYSPPDEPIEVYAAAEGAAVIVSVADRGPGIPAEEMDLIFERFYRSSGAAKQAGGAGIGLTVCRRLIEAQEGRIWASPREGGGLVISFSLPADADGREQ